MFIPYQNSNILSYLNDKANIISQNHLDEGTMIDLEISPMDYQSYIDYIWVDNKS